MTCHGVNLANAARVPMILISIIVICESWMLQMSMPHHSCDSVSSFPLDRIEQGSEALTFHAVDHFNEADAAFEVRAEVREHATVL